MPLSFFHVGVDRVERVLEARRGEHQRAFVVAVAAAVELALVVCVGGEDGEEIEADRHDRGEAHAELVSLC